MNKKQFINVNGILLEQDQLTRYLEKIASEHILQEKSDKITYPIKRLDDNFDKITKTYELLNFDLKIGIDIHPAGEWLLDNYYVLEETYKTIKRDLNLNKYKNLPGIQNGEYKGFARIYVLASEIIVYTDGQIDEIKLKTLLNAYQSKKTLSMDEIWNSASDFDQLYDTSDLYHSCGSDRLPEGGIRHAGEVRKLYGRDREDDCGARGSCLFLCEGRGHALCL